MNDALQKKLAEEIGEVTWHWLRPHLQRDALFCVAPELDLAAVGAAIAVDDAASVRGWLSSGALVRPQPQQVERWEADPTRSLRMLIVQPFVLIQDLPSSLN
jgi:hypothetical protein